MAKTKKQLENLTLTAQTRELLGKKAKRLRKEGLIPANIYGPNFKSISISVPVKEFIHAYKTARETGIVHITLNGESIPTLIKHVQRHPLHPIILHVDFRKIDLKQKIETTVPVKVTGESEAINQKGAVLLTQRDHLTIEALPQDIPSEIEIDISPLKDIGNEIKVADLPKSTTYVVKDEPDAVIISAIAHKEESVTPETTAATPEVITEKPEEGAESTTGAAETSPAAEQTAKEDKKE